MRQSAVPYRAITSTLAFKCLISKLAAYHCTYSRRAARGPYLARDELLAINGTRSAQNAIMLVFAERESNATNT